MPQKLINKGAAAVRLGIAVPTLSKALEAADFPGVERRGAKGRDWLIDFKKFAPAYRRYAATKARGRGPRAGAKARGEVRPGAMPANGEPAGPSIHQEKTQLESALLRNRLRKESGELVEVSELRPAIEAAIIRNRVAFGHLPHRLARRLGLSAEDQRVAQEMVDQCCNAFADELMRLGGDDAGGGNGDAERALALPRGGAPREADGADQRR